ncbi:MAG: single-stranded DNA-binding protein [Pigmentiphaga sp.]
MADFNQVMMIGRLTRDVELRCTTSGMSVASFGLAVNRYRKDGEPKTTFVDMKAFGREAENASRYLAKGATVFVCGHLDLEEWEGRDGHKRSKLVVIADNIQYLDQKPPSAENAPQSTEASRWDRTPVRPPERARGPIPAAQPALPTATSDDESNDIPF